MSRIIRLPGLIDIHVHLRDPGQTQKEDFSTGTMAALAGGVTAVFDMPNNKKSILTEKLLKEKNDIAKKKVFCDYGLYFGTDGRNTEEFEKVADKVVGLKVYLNITTGRLVIEDIGLVNKVFKSWPKSKVLVVHAEKEMIDLAIDLCRKYGNKLHITHISNRQDLEKIIEAKLHKLTVTCDVTPHHLFLTKKDYEYKGGLLEVRPGLQSQNDLDFLWDNLSRIDCIATDHAPHTLIEKKAFDPPSGVPGLESMLSLLLAAVKQGKLTINDIVRLTNGNPQKIFGIKQDDKTYIEVDADEKYMIDNNKLYTKCGWSPFAGRKVYGRVKKVFIRGKKVFEDGKVLIDKGFGRNILY